jgi:Glycosyl hydrolases family 15
MAPLSSGLFPAAAPDPSVAAVSGYGNVWVRDNVHVAHNLIETGEVAAGCKAVAALARFYHRYRHRFLAILERRADPSDTNQRPHIRFDGTRLEELPERWSHAQNDALGYFLWILCRLLRAGQLEPTAERLSLVPLFVTYFEALPYWLDADSGHWEEQRKVEASSIGAALAALGEVQRLAEERAELGLWEALGPARLADLIREGRGALDATLPWETRPSATDPGRRYDAALLFLVEPLSVVREAQARGIVADVREHLLGEHGIRRYLGDSYWAPDYRHHLAPEERTVEVSGGRARRDALARPGLEAQWCIFDPVLSSYFGRRYRSSGDPADLDQQVWHLNRCLAQLTGAKDPAGPLCCPEAYFLEDGYWIPNDHTPLLWTQANLRMAFRSLTRSLERIPEHD